MGGAGVAISVEVGKGVTESGWKDVDEFLEENK
ncbi:hypothetical protein N752_30065 [Desulforamulus aquiferis]|nr:hypothetical protein N752_30065 [Desulforamulus aquiferis]